MSLKLPYLRASYTKFVGPIVRSNFVLRFTFPGLYSLRPLGDWAPFLRHPVYDHDHFISVQ
jgi:hypothetical protein